MNINREPLTHIDYAEAERRVLVARQLARETGEPVVTAVQQYTGRPDFPIVDYTNLMRDDSEREQQWNRRVEEEQALPPGLEWFETDLGIGQSVYVRLTPPSMSRIVARNPQGTAPELGLHIGTVIDRVISDFGREKNYLIRIPDGTTLRLTEEAIVENLSMNEIRANGQPMPRPHTGGPYLEGAEVEILHQNGVWERGTVTRRTLINSNYVYSVEFPNIPNAPDGSSAATQLSWHGPRTHMRPFPDTQAETGADATPSGLIHFATQQASAALRLNNTLPPNVTFYINDGIELIKLERGAFFYRGQKVDDVNQIYEHFTEWTYRNQGLPVPEPVDRNPAPRKNRYQILLEKSHE